MLPKWPAKAAPPDVEEMLATVLQLKLPEVELDAMADLGVIPRENADAVWKAKDVEFDVARIDEIWRDVTSIHGMLLHSLQAVVALALSLV